jgi:tryptophanyl-tRNA synthetase
MKYLVGVQPTGKLHIGNYLGCIKKGLEYQEQGHDVTFLLANYHSLTTDAYSDVTKKELELLGAKNIIEQTPEYTELFFKMACKLNLGTLLKMSQYKDKKDSVEYDLGLLLYPVLMAADIVMNDPHFVIVGRDQIQHMELANQISRRMGGREYQYEMGHVDKIMSLLDPTKKMSKSLGEKHVLYLFDEDYEAKLKKANATPEGLENLNKISADFGVQQSEFTSNLEYKMALANAIKKQFKKEVAYE